MDLITLLITLRFVSLRSKRLKICKIHLFFHLKFLKKITLIEHFLMEEQYEEMNEESNESTIRANIFR